LRENYRRSFVSRARTSLNTPTYLFTVPTFGHKEHLAVLRGLFNWLVIKQEQGDFRAEGREAVFGTTKLKGSKKVARRW
jgi:hypothetical protein